MRGTGEIGAGPVFGQPTRSINWKEEGVRRAGSERLPALDAARGLAILAVVALHGLYSGPSAKVPGLVWHLVYTLSAVRMPLLLLVSGFLSAGIIADPRRAVPRVTNFVWLYLLWSLLSYPLEYHTALRPPPGLGHALVAPESYVWFLAVLALLTAGLALLSRAGVAVLGLGLLAWHLFASPVNLGWHALVAFGPFFCLGALVPAFVHRSLRVGVPTMLVLLGGFLAVRTLASGEVEEVASGLLGCAAFLPLAGLAARIPVGGRWLAWLGRRTLPVYLIHTPVLILVRLIAPVGLAWLALAALAAVLLPLAIYRARNGLGLRIAFGAPDQLAALMARAWRTTAHWPLPAMRTTRDLNRPSASGRHHAGQARSIFSAETNGRRAVRSRRRSLGSGA